jgi:DNA repair exonuclease SbcCD ATPase subunit
MALYLQAVMGMNQFGMFDLTSSPNKQQQQLQQQQQQKQMQDSKDHEISRLKEELHGLRNRLGAWDEGLNHARAACDAWQKETALAAKKAEMALKEKEAAIAKVGQLQKEMEDLQGGQGQYLHAIKRTSELPTLPIGVLKAFEWQLRKDLQEVEKVRKS